MLKPFVLLISNILERPLRNGSMIQDRYNVLKHLGSGSYGHSYLVHDCLTDRNAVLKMLRLHKRITKNGRSGFLREMEILKGINHSCFPKFLESAMFNKIPFFTMEYIDGKTFEELIFEEGKRYGERESFTIGYELLEIIEYLQQHNIVHRDIRIPNIMWTGNNVKVIDLGLAKDITQYDIDKDEEIAHPRKQIDFKSDFYGLGHFLLFLLYSQYSPSKNQKEKSWEEELDISRESKQVIRKLLQIDPPYNICQEVKQDFQDLINKKILERVK